MMQITRYNNRMKNSVKVLCQEEWMPKKYVVQRIASSFSRESKESFQSENAKIIDRTISNEN